MKLELTGHPYYCEASVEQVFESWKDFEDEWASADNDYNCLFRFDIEKMQDEEGNELDSLEIIMTYILQRKGRILHARVINLKEQDMRFINSFLQEKYSYIKSLWEEFE